MKVGDTVKYYPTVTGANKPRRGYALLVKRAVVYSIDESTVRLCVDLGGGHTSTKKRYFSVKPEQIIEVV